MGKAPWSSCLPEVSQLQPNFATQLVLNPQRSTVDISTNNEVNLRSKDVTGIQQQRPESTRVFTRMPSEMLP